MSKWFFSKIIASHKGTDVCFTVYWHVITVYSNGSLCTMLMRMGWRLRNLTSMPRLRSNLHYEKEIGWKSFEKSMKTGSRGYSLVMLAIPLESFPVLTSNCWNKSMNFSPTTGAPEQMNEGKNKEGKTERCVSVANNNSDDLSDCQLYDYWTSVLFFALAPGLMDDQTAFLMISLLMYGALAICFGKREGKDTYESIVRTEWR